MYITGTSSIKTWQSFRKRVRSKGCRLLKRLDNYPNSILVTGCQRSGTTALARTITRSDGMVNYWFGRDDELDAALILSGEVPHEPRGRYCFQTTYLNECYKEYLEHDNDHKMIWMIRNPYSVVYSMLHNWRKFALNELFEGCGRQYMTHAERNRYELLGRFAISSLQRACLSYVGKLSQLFFLSAEIKKTPVLVVDYDELVYHKERYLPAIYRFLDLPYRRCYLNGLHKRNVNKSRRLSKKQIAVIDERCVPLYEWAQELSLRL